MKVNLTLLIQGINFFLFYWLVRVFFFKPLVTYIEQQEEEKEALRSAICQRQEIITEIYNERQLKWHECRAYCSHIRPLVEETFVFIEYQLDKNPIGPVLSDQERASLIQQGSDYIVRRIEKIDHGN